MSQLVITITLQLLVIVCLLNYSNNSFTKLVIHKVLAQEETPADSSPQTTESQPSNKSEPQSPAADSPIPNTPTTSNETTDQSSLATPQYASKNQVKTVAQSKV